MNQAEKKTTCESKGHFWQASAFSPNTRHCGRTGCKALLHFINGEWIETTTSKPKAIPPQAEQSGLWR